MNKPIPPRALLVEDHPDLAAETAFNLSQEGIEVTVAHTLAQARSLLGEQDFDVAVLDVGLPDGSGNDLAQELQHNGDMRLVMLSARVSSDDRMLGYAAGADLYISKPVDAAELAAQLHRLTQRMRPARAAWTLHNATRRLLTPNQQTLELTSQEADLLHMLSQAPEQLCARLRIERAIWGEPDEYTGRRLDVLINRLRDKIRSANFPEPVLITHRLKGYQFVGDITVVK
jgi:two-component system torCAD operon response regulator TorR